MPKQRFLNDLSKEEFEYGQTLAKRDKEYKENLKKESWIKHQEVLKQRDILLNMKETAKQVEYLQKEQEKQEDREIEKWANLKDLQKQIRTEIEKEWLEYYIFNQANL